MNLEEYIKGTSLWDKVSDHDGWDDNIDVWYFCNLISVFLYKKAKKSKIKEVADFESYLFFQTRNGSQERFSDSFYAESYDTLFNRVR